MKWEYAFNEAVLEENMHDLLNFSAKGGWELITCNRFERMEGRHREEELVVRYALVFKRMLEET